MLKGANTCQAKILDLENIPLIILWGHNQDGGVENAELTSSHQHTKLQLYVEQLSLKMNWRLEEQLFYK